MALNPSKSVAAISASIFLLRLTEFFFNDPMNFEYEVSRTRAAAAILTTHSFLMSLLRRRLPT